MNPAQPKIVVKKVIKLFSSNLTTRKFSCTEIDAPNVSNVPFIAPKIFGLFSMRSERTSFIVANQILHLNLIAKCSNSRSKILLAISNSKGKLTVLKRPFDAVLSGIALY